MDGFSSLVGYLIKNNRRHAVTWNMGRLFFCFDIQEQDERQCDNHLFHLRITSLPKVSPSCEETAYRYGGSSSIIAQRETSAQMDVSLPFLICAACRLSGKVACFPMCVACSPLRRCQHGEAPSLSFTLSCRSRLRLNRANLSQCLPIIRLLPIILGKKRNHPVKA